MGRRPRTAEFMTFSEIVDYAIDTYPIIKLQTIGFDEKDNRKKIYNNILTAFIRHGLIEKTNNKAENRKTDGQNSAGEKIPPVSKNNVSSRKFSLVVAAAVIEHDVCAYYQKREADSSIKTKLRFEKMDRQMYQEYMQKIDEDQNEMINIRDGLVPDVYPDDTNPEKDAEYHIPIADYTNEFADEVVANVMRHFIYEDYDFHEEEYRKDLKKRSDLLSTDDPPCIYDGYSEQTWKLEHPFGSYEAVNFSVSMEEESFR